MIGNYLGKDVTIHYEPRNRYDVDRTLADIDRISYDAGWEPRIEFEDGLKGQIEWQKKQYESI